jgi:hypothetical protein
MDLDYQTAIIGSVQFAVGYGFWSLGQFCSERIKQPVGRALLSWPWTAARFWRTSRRDPGRGVVC